MAAYAGTRRRSHRHASFEDPTWKLWNLGIPAFMVTMIVLSLIPYGWFLIMVLLIAGTVLIVRRLSPAPTSGRHRALHGPVETIEPEHVRIIEEPEDTLYAEPMGATYGITSVPPVRRFNLRSTLPDTLVFSAAAAFLGYEMLRQQYWGSYSGPLDWDEANARAQRPWR